MKFAAGDHWVTPVWLIDAVRDVGPIGLDPFAGKYACHAWRNWRPDEGDSLQQDWGDLMGRAILDRSATGAEVSHRGGGTLPIVYSNPSYSRRWLGPSVDMIARQYERWRARGRRWPSVALVPAATGSGWFHDVIFRTATAGCFVRRRVRFIDPRTGRPQSSGRFWSFVALWGPPEARDRFETAFDGLGELVRLNIDRR